MYEISVREATTADLPHIVGHRRSMFEAMGERDNRALDMMQASSEAYFRSALEDGSYRGWVAETVGGTIVAGGGIVISHWPGSPRAPQTRRATILNMYTNPEFRRRGLARRLMRIMLDWLREHGFAEVSLHASDFARPLYEQLGFGASNELRLALLRKPSADSPSPATAARTQSAQRVQRFEDIRELTVREATQRDTAPIQRCLAAAFEPFHALYTLDAFADTVPTVAGLRRRLATMRLFVAEWQGSVVGTIGCFKQTLDEGHLRGMAVVPEWQGSGVAAMLLAAAEAEMRRQGCARLTLNTTEPLQRAVRFYEKHGFRHSGRVGDFFGMRLNEYVKRL